MISPLIRISFPAVVMCTVTAGAWFAPVIVHAADAAYENEDAIRLHAQALEAELDGDLERALELIVQARELAPNETGIAFDESRLRLALGKEQSAEELNAAGNNPDSRLLKAYAHLSGGDRAAALGEVTEVLRAQPNRAEALSLRKAIQRSDPNARRSTVNARARMGVQVDSNVNVVADNAPTQLEAARVFFDGALAVGTQKSDFYLDLALGLQMGFHMNDRNNLEPFDPATVVIGTRAQWTSDSISYGFQLSGTEVFLDDFEFRFLEELNGRGDFTWQGENLAFGVFGVFGYRNFIQGNPEGPQLDADGNFVLNANGNPLPQANDRDGPKASGGVFGQFARGNWGATVVAGWQAELAVGDDLREHGFDGSATLRFAPDPFSVAVSFAYQLRDYYDHSESRQDNRLTPRLSVVYSISEHLFVDAGYSVVLNLSEISTPGDRFDYTRHIGQLAVGGRW